MEFEDKKKRILELLKQGEKSTSEITSLLNRNYYDVIQILEEMARENLIKKINIKSFTYWKLKDKDDN